MKNKIIASVIAALFLPMLILYAAKARKRMGIAEPKKPFVDPLSEENITKLYKEEKIPPRRMAEMLDVSVRTIYLRLAKYGLTKVKCR